MLFSSGVFSGRTWPGQADQNFSSYYEHQNFTTINIHFSTTAKNLYAMNTLLYIKNKDKYIKYLNINALHIYIM